jgi:hypothetical protein
MKTQKTIALVAALLLGLCHNALLAHGEKKIAGPNRGRVITAAEPYAEFFVQPDRKVRITFVDDHGKVVAPAAQVVTVTAGERAKPTNLKFSRQGDTLVSDIALPAGADIPAVVQIRQTPDARPAVERFHVNLAPCPECKNPEYACVCDH